MEDTQLIYILDVVLRVFSNPNSKICRGVCKSHRSLKVRDVVRAAGFPGQSSAKGQSVWVKDCRYKWKSLDVGLPFQLEDIFSLVTWSMQLCHPVVFLFLLFWKDSCFGRSVAI